MHASKSLEKRRSAEKTEKAAEGFVPEAAHQHLASPAREAILHVRPDRLDTFAGRQRRKRRQRGQRWLDTWAALAERIARVVRLVAADSIQRDASVVLILPRTAARPPHRRAVALARLVLAAKVIDLHGTKACARQQERGTPRRARAGMPAHARLGKPAAREAHQDQALAADEAVVDVGP